MYISIYITHIHPLDLFKAFSRAHCRDSSQPFHLPFAAKRYSNQAETFFSQALLRGTRNTFYALVRLPGSGGRADTYELLNIAPKRYHFSITKLFM
jgi:hypothetical protein